jgi:hypothetical protein
LFGISRIDDKTWLGKGKINLQNIFPEHLTNN